MRYPRLGDIKKALAQSYGVLVEEGVALRGTFLVDRTGIIRQETINDLPLGRSVDETLRLVDALEFTEEHGEVCPAGWQKGKVGMKADPRGVASFLRDHGGSS